MRIGNGLKVLLTAHGTPVAEPRRLVELQDALEAIRSGVLKPQQTAENRHLYRFDHFSILMGGSGN